MVRNLDDDAKQSYVDMLIYQAAGSKTPEVVLSTTMCEEKKALKERLVAIMKSKQYMRTVIIIAVILVVAAIGLAVALGAGKGAAGNETPPLEARPDGVIIASEGKEYEAYQKFLAGYSADEDMFADGDPANPQDIADELIPIPIGHDFQIIINGNPTGNQDISLYKYTGKEWGEVYSNNTAFENPQEPGEYILCLVFRWDFEDGSYNIFQYCFKLINSAA